MDEIDETSLEQVAAAHDALDLSWLDDARAPPRISRRAVPRCKRRSQVQEARRKATERI
jgi:hypothetical protein